MLDLVREESVNDRIHLKFAGFSSICRYDKQKDTGTIEVTYCPGPGRRLVDSKKLLQYLNSFEKREIAMESIPIEILKFCIEECLKQQPPTRYA
jgi:NADPH-dependent 7-cyano-7-deazaguanine reductase QueF